MLVFSESGADRERETLHLPIRVSCLDEPSQPSPSSPALAHNEAIRRGESALRLIAQPWSSRHGAECPKSSSPTAAQCPGALRQAKTFPLAINGLRSSTPPKPSSNLSFHMPWMADSASTIEGSFFTRSAPLSRARGRRRNAPVGQQDFPPVDDCDDRHVSPSCSKRVLGCPGLRKRKPDGPTSSRGR